MRFLEHSKTTHALGRVGDVEEVAAMIRFLASKEASFVTGQTIGVDGGIIASCVPDKLETRQGHKYCRKHFSSFFNCFEC